MTDVQKLGKRSRLIQASLALVYRHGFKVTRLADIAAELGEEIGKPHPSDRVFRSSAPALK
jgi:AcrR family transcriptional regulator